MSRVRLPNPHLAELKNDTTFHLLIDNDENLKKHFSDVKFVCIGGTPNRVRSLSFDIARTVYNKDISDVSQLDHSFSNERFSGYKIRNVWCVSHGMGLPSVSIVLHEIFKVLQYAECTDVTLIRLGTCGGIGIEGGTVVVSDGVLTSGYKSVFKTSCLGKPIELPIQPDLTVVQELMSCRQFEFPLVQGHTYCAEDFYTGQGRLDGAICDYDETDKQDFLTQLHNKGVRNIEMESAAVLGLSNKAGIRAAVICVVLLNRKVKDSVTASHETLQEWDQRLIQVVTSYILSKTNLETSN